MSIASRERFKEHRRERSRRRWARRFFKSFREVPACFYCGEPQRWRDDDAPTVEHLVPYSHGGKALEENVRLVHESCNLAVGNLPVHIKLRIAGEMERGQVPAWVYERFEHTKRGWEPR